MTGEWSPHDDAEAVRRATPSSSLAKAYHATFRTPAGAVVLENLRSRTVEKVLQPTDSDAALRQLEGQRQVFKFIQTMIAQAERGE